MWALFIWLQAFIFVNPNVVWGFNGRYKHHLGLVPDLPVAPEDEAGLTKTFQTWPRGWFHIP